MVERESSCKYMNLQAKDFATVSSRSRHVLGKFPNGKAAQTVSEVQIAWQPEVQIHGRRSIWQARSSADFESGAK